MALVLSLVVSGGFTLLLSKQMKASATKAPVTSFYVAAARELDPGEILKAGDLQVVGWPKSLPLQGAFEKSGDLVGRAVLSPIGKGQPFLSRGVSESGSGAGLAARIPDGMRAIALRSDEVVGVGGFLNPGSHVDVLVTYRPDGATDAHTATALQDATVLAAGQKVEPDPSGKPSSVTVVTLLLSPDDAQRAVLASTQGTVHFVLRNGSDRVVTTTLPIQLSSLGGDAPLAVARPALYKRRKASIDVDSEIETIVDGKADSNTNTAKGPANQQNTGLAQ